MGRPIVKTFGDVRVRDLVSLSLDDEPFLVEQVEKDKNNLVFLNDGTYYADVEDEILIHHRPRPEGKTEADMLFAIKLAMSHPSNSSLTYSNPESIIAVRNAIEAWELSLPPEKPIPKRDPILRYRIVD